MSFAPLQALWALVVGRQRGLLALGAAVVILVVVWIWALPPTPEQTVSTPPVDAGPRTEPGATDDPKDDDQPEAVPRKRRRIIVVD